MVVFVYGRNVRQFEKLTAEVSGGSSGGCRWRMPPPQQDPILSFSHVFPPKSGCIGGQVSTPPNGLAPPQWEILDPQLEANIGETRVYCRAPATRITTPRAIL